VIIFGNRAHYSAIGGVENSIRNMVKVVAGNNNLAVMVCREPLQYEELDAASLELDQGIELVTYKDEYDQPLLRRLLYLRQGGEILPQVYLDLHAKYPNAKLVVRHHMHVLAAHTAGFRDIRYLVPSLTVNQLREDLLGASVANKMRIKAHMLIDGWLQSKAFAIARLFVFSASMESQVRQRLPARAKSSSITRVTPGVDGARFKQASAAQKRVFRQQLNLPEQQTLFLFVGRFVQAKGVGYLIEAFASLPATCSVIFLGEGDREASMRETIKSLGVGGRALLVGRTSRVETYYRACDVFVMSSTKEPLGQTILEAAACGIPIAAFGPGSGVVTATHELGLDKLIAYADKLSSEDLAEAMLRAAALAARSAEGTIKDSHDVQNRYSWASLVVSLTA
jgi:glycosyltransferase involved in cell wall biosynthesis